MLSYVGLAILHGCLAAAFVEGLLRAWRVSAPNQRLALRTMALLSPVVCTTALSAAAPFREAASFATRWALYAGVHWDNLRIGGLPFSSLATVLLAAAGTLLFLRDAVPFLRDRIRPRDEQPELPPGHPAHARLAAVAAALPPAARTAIPAIRVLPIAGAVLYCAGVAHPVMTISTGSLACLDDEELGAALAHELEHVRRQDPAWGWALLIVRTLQFFNPATQIVGRQIVEEIETRSDRRVADLGMAPALARAIDKLSSDSRPLTDLASGSSMAPAVGTLAHRAASRATAARNARLLALAPPDPPGIGHLRIALAAGGIAVLLFLVV